MATKLDNLIKTSSDGKKSIDSAAFNKYFEDLGLSSPFESKKDIGDRVSEFSYLNRQKPSTVDEFCYEYGIDVKANSVFATEHGITINPYPDHVKDMTGEKKMPDYKHPLKTSLGLDALNKTRVGTVISAKPAKHVFEDKYSKGDPNTKGVEVDTFEVVLEYPDKNGELRRSAMRSMGLAPYFSPSDDGAEPQYKPGDTLAIIHKGTVALDEINPNTNQPLQRNDYDFERIQPENLPEAIKHYNRADYSYNRIARHGLGRSGSNRFIKNLGQDGDKAISFADMTFEDFNLARGATDSLRPTTMQEKKEFDAQKERYLQDSMEQGFEPKIEDFAKKNNYAIKSNSQLDNETAKSLKIVPQVEMPKDRKQEKVQTAEANSTKESLDDIDLEATSEKSDATDAGADSEKDADFDDLDLGKRFANPEDKDQQNINAQRRSEVPQLTGGAVLAASTISLGKKLFNSLKGVDSVVKDRWNEIDPKIRPVAEQMKDTMRSIHHGWKSYTPEDAMREVVSPRVNGNSLARKAMSQEIEKQIAHAYETRLNNIEAGLDVREADKQFLKKSSELYGVDPTKDPNFSKKLESFMVESDAALANAPDHLKADIKSQTQRDLKQLYGQAAGHEGLVDHPKFAQNATRLKALETGLDNEMSQAYEKRLSDIASGTDVRLVDQSFNERMKKIYGIDDNNVAFDQKIKDTLVQQDKNRKSLDDPEYHKQQKDNLNQIKNSFTEQSDLFELVSENTAKKELEREKPSYNPYEDPLRYKNAKDNAENYFTKKDKSDDLGFKLGEKLRESVALLTQIISRFIPGSRGPSGP